MNASYGLKMGVLITRAEMYYKDIIRNQRGPVPAGQPAEANCDSEDHPEQNKVLERKKNSTELRQVKYVKCKCGQGVRMDHWGAHVRKNISHTNSDLNSVPKAVHPTLRASKVYELNSGSTCSRQHAVSVTGRTFGRPRL